jgi:ABC-type dipeptide/oligopeptide/nickel transport system ATPase component
MAFTKATKKKGRARIALIGPSGSGKTIDALTIARQLVGPQGRIALRDSEHGSAAKYADRFDFDSDEPGNHSPDSYIAAIREAETGGYDCLILDSWSHAWAGAGGILEQSDKKGKKFDVWKDLTPQQNRMIEALLAAKLHVIVTMRTKTEWVLEKERKQDGREVNVPRKVGLAPVQRQDVDYEFDVVALIDVDHSVQIDKTRCSALDGKTYEKDRVLEIGDVMREWLSDGEDVEAKKAKGKELSEALKAAGMPTGEWLAWMAKALGVPEVKGLGELSIPNIEKLIGEAKKMPPAQPAAKSGQQKGAA